MSSTTAHFPAGLPLLASLITALRTAAAQDPGLSNLYRLASGSDSVNPAVAVELDARRAG